MSSLTAQEEERFDELKEEGLHNLKGEKRKEYKRYLAKKYEKYLPKEKPSIVKAPATIEIDKNKLDGLIARIESLESEKKLTKEPGEWEVDKEAFTGNRTATMRTKEGKYLIDWKFDPHAGIGKIYFNPNTREKELIYVITLLDEKGETSKEEFVWGELPHLPTVEVKLMDKEVQQLKKNTGVTRNKVKVDFDGYKSTKGSTVPLMVTAKRITYTVELPDGRKLKLDSSRLNA